MKTNIEEISLMCFDPKIEAKLLSKIDNNSTKEELIKAVQAIDPEINTCCECGDNLVEIDDGHMTTWGTCRDCIDKCVEEEDIAYF